MKIMELRLNHQKQKTTIPLRKISEVIESIEYGVVEYDGLHDTKRLTYTVRLDSGTDHLVDSVVKIFEITWTNGNKVETEIPLEKFYEWYQKNISEEQ